ncbi:hypothetical protein ANO14919_081680 [Xylariales sp. No.14919]|nr:hypothetical protein ANO14919_081680 [Xylariales sp. No.14919]
MGALVEKTPSKRRPTERLSRSSTRLSDKKGGMHGLSAQQIITKEPKDVPGYAR